jgi:nucleoside-diphosphate-sugar epimerase
MKILITGGSGFIGTNAVEEFAARGHEICDLSIDEPLNSAHRQYWQACDILDREGVGMKFREFQPEWVLHLAARADCDEHTTVEKGYPVNTVGTQNVLDAMKATPSIKRAVITSTQFVCGPGPLPSGDEHYFPATIYGQSKVLTEQFTRAANLPCCWTLIRPTNVWGPWHMRYRREFWRVLQRRMYLHPGRETVIRSYGYVKNVVDQVRRIFGAPIEKVAGRTIYVGDRPINLLEWVNGFSRLLAGREVTIVPRPLMRALALLGDVPTRLTGRAFLINSSRYQSMVTDYSTPMEPTFALLGENPFSMQQGIEETVKWLGQYTGPGTFGGGA